MCQRRVRSDHVNTVTESTLLHRGTLLIRSRWTTSVYTSVLVRAESHHNGINLMRYAVAVRARCPIYQAMPHYTIKLLFKIKCLIIIIKVLMKPKFIHTSAIREGHTRSKKMKEVRIVLNWHHRLYSPFRSISRCLNEWRRRKNFVLCCKSTNPLIFSKPLIQFLY